MPPLSGILAALAYSGSGSVVHPTPHKKERGVATADQLVEQGDEDEHSDQKKMSRDVFQERALSIVE